MDASLIITKVLSILIERSRLQDAREFPLTSILSMLQDVCAKSLELVKSNCLTKTNTLRSYKTCHNQTKTAEAVLSLKLESLCVMKVTEKDSKTRMKLLLC